MNEQPVKTPHCAMCGELLEEPGRYVPVIVNGNGQALWLHVACVPDYHGLRPKESLYEPC